LSEVAVLPAELSVRQWVAHAGLDPRPMRSGSSVHPPVHISKRGNVYLRRALFMPALVAVRRNVAVQRFATALTTRGKAPLAILVAVMRKLLHAIYGMLKTDTDFDGEKFRRSVLTAACPLREYLQDPACDVQSRIGGQGPSATNAPPTRLPTRACQATFLPVPIRQPRRLWSLSATS